MVASDSIDLGVAFLAAIPATLAAVAALIAANRNRSKLNSIDASVNSRPEGDPKLYDVVTVGLARLDGKIDGVHDRVSALDEKTEKRHDQLDRKLDNTARRIDDRINAVVDGTATRREAG